MLLFALSSLGCASTAVGYAPDTTPAQRDEQQAQTPLPNVAPTSELVSVQVVETFDVPPEEFGEWFMKLPLEDAIAETKRFPKVQNIVPLNPMNWDTAGARRRVEFDDGSAALEQILVADLPRRFHYVSWNYTGQAGRLLQYATGEFTFSAKDGGTQVTWTYAFSPKRNSSRWIVRRFANKDFREFMLKSFERMQATCDRNCPGSAT